MICDIFTTYTQTCKNMHDNISHKKTSKLDYFILRLLSTIKASLKKKKLKFEKLYSCGCFVHK